MIFKATTPYGRRSQNMTSNTEPTSENIPTYEQVCDAMEDYVNDQSHPGELRRQVFGWMSEYSERNHHRMTTIIRNLLPQEDEYETAANAAAIYKIGFDIDKEGGFTAQRACFYIAMNFIDAKDKRMMNIERNWKGAGQWK